MITGQIYVISDLHFNQRIMIPFGKRPFKNIKEMNIKMIDNWNKTVRKDDIVIIAGDLGSGSYLFFNWLLNKLNGKKILIKGNHDIIFRLRKLKKTNSIKIYKKIKIDIEGIDILFTHRPQKKEKGLFSLNIHGHYHKKLLPKKFLKDYYYNVAVEHNMYKPVSLTEILYNKGICIQDINLNEIMNQILYKNNSALA